MRFPSGHRAGLGMVLAMTFAAFLAGGAPGLAGGQPADNFMDLSTRTQVQLDEIVVVTSGDEAEEHPPLLEGVLGAKGTVAAGGGAGRGGRAPLKRIDFRKLALAEAKRAGIRRPILFVRQIAAESGMQPCATSGAGAIGIAQIMPGTARAWKVDPWIPEDALRAAATHMARYERQLGTYRLALAAYNAGPGAVKAYGGVPPYAETRHYIARISDLHEPLAGMNQVFEIPQRMRPEFGKRLRSLLQDVRRHQGNFRVEEGWRSYEESLRVWKKTKRQRGGWANAPKWAAPPGCSNHVRGYAADLLGSKRGISLAHQLAGRHGLVFPMAHEPWHVELRGISTQSG